ncbi:MAG: hypothetical protein Roseis2KO_26510 [Roseivirga sp.]
MPDYSFYDAFSPIDFERFSKDVIQTREKIDFKLSKRGKDNGVDFIHKGHEVKIIGQAKNYKNYKDLIRQLRHEELQKVRRLKPTRYILCTAVDLTNSQVKDIVELYHPYISQEIDVLGKHELNELLGQPAFKWIELKYNKLWIASSNVLEKVIDQTIYRRQYNIIRSELYEIHKVSKYYVQNLSYDEADAIISNNQYVLISGSPGSGKTTLGRMLALKYIENQYDLVVISQGISEGWDLYRKDRKQVFLFDDFLGSFQFDDGIASGANIRELDRFIRTLRGDPHKILILTTREYILRRGQFKHREYLNENDISLFKCIVDASKYTRYEKAEILFNHLYHSDLNRSFIEFLSEESHYKDIIGHTNYTPRLIEDFIEKVFPSLNNSHSLYDGMVYSELKSYLDDPHSFWSNLFERQSVASQILLLTIFISSEPTELIRLKNTFESTSRVYSKEFDNLVLAPNSFELSLRELSDTFISIDDFYGYYNIVGFQNPSVNDFLLEYLRKNRYWIPILIDGSLFWNQLTFVFTTIKGRKFDIYSEDEMDLPQLSGQQIYLDPSERTLLKSKAILALDKSEVSNAIKREFAHGFTFESPLYEIQIYKLYDLQWLFNAKENPDVREILVSKIESFFDLRPNAPSLGSLDTKSLEFLPEVIHYVAEFVSTDSAFIIENYFNSIGTTDEFFGLTSFKKTYSEAYTRFLKENIIRIRAKIRAVILNDLEYYQPDDYNEGYYIDQMFDWKAESIFKDFGMRMTKSFKSKMLDCAYDVMPVSYIRSEEKAREKEDRKRRMDEKKKREQEEKNILSLFEQVAPKENNKIDGLIDFERLPHESFIEYMDRFLNATLSDNGVPISFLESVEFFAFKAIQDGKYEFSIKYLEKSLIKATDWESDILETINSINPIFIEHDKRYSFGNDDLYGYLIARHISKMSPDFRSNYLSSKYLDLFYSGPYFHPTYWSVWEMLDRKSFYEEMIIPNWNNFYSKIDFRNKFTVLKSFLKEVQLKVEVSIEGKEMILQGHSTAGIGLLGELLSYFDRYYLFDLPADYFYTELYEFKESENSDDIMFFNGSYQDSLLNYIKKNIPEQPYWFDESKLIHSFNVLDETNNDIFLKVLEDVGMVETVNRTLRDTNSFIQSLKS